MVNYKWKASFILNGASCQQQFRRGDWTVEGIVANDNSKKVMFTKTFEDTGYIGYRDVYCKIENEVDRLLNASIAGMLFNINVNDFPTVSDFDLSLQNTPEIINSQTSCSDEV